MPKEMGIPVFRTYHQMVEVLNSLRPALLSKVKSRFTNARRPVARVMSSAA